MLSYGLSDRLCVIILRYKYLGCVVFWYSIKGYVRRDYKVYERFILNFGEVGRIDFGEN